MNKLRNLLNASFFRFLLVGVINTLVGTAVMFLLYNAAGLYRWGQIGYWLSTIGNYTVGSIVSFFLNKHFTFRSQEKGPQVVLRFATTIVVCMVLAYGIAQQVVAWALTGVGVSPQLQGNLSMLAGMCLFVLLNYCGQRFFAFKPSAEDDEDADQPSLSDGQ
jgi:putative flippase GtrA